MLKVRGILKETMTNIVVSFFFSVFVIFLFSLLIENKITPYFNTINSLSLGETKEKPVSFDTVKKRLISYPTYGTVFAKINIPKINLDLPVYHGDTLELLRYGVGHMAGSYFPGEGEGIVMDAHNSKGFFANIYDLTNGDKIIVTTSYGKFTYEMYDTKVIYKTDIDSLKIKRDDEVLMLYTCYPRYYVGLRVQRYVIFAKLVEAEYA